MNAIIRSEWTKLRSVRSTWITALCAIGAAVALGVLGVSDQLGNKPLPDDWDPTGTSLEGFLFAQLLVGMLGALGMTSEHATGMIGTSLSTVPSRSRLLAAKAVVVGGISLVVAAATTLVSFAVVQLALGGDAAAGLGDPGVIGALAAGTVYLPLVGIAGLAVGTLTRSATGSLTVLVGAALLVPAIGPGLPGAVGDWFDRYWPISAGQDAYAVVPPDGAVAPGVGLAILAAATAALVLAGHTVLRRRDL